MVFPPSRECPGLLVLLLPPTTRVQADSHVGAKIGPISSRHWRAVAVAISTDRPGFCRYRASICQPAPETSTCTTHVVNYRFTPPPLKKVIAQQLTTPLVPISTQPVASCLLCFFVAILLEPIFLLLSRKRYAGDRSGETWPV